MGNEGLRAKKPWGKKLWGKKPLAEGLAAEGLAKDLAADRAEQVLSRRSALQALLGAGAGFVVAGCNHQESDPNPIIQPGATPDETFDPDKHQFDPSKHAPGADGGTAETGPTASSNPDGSGNSEPGSGGTGQEQDHTPERSYAETKAGEFMDMPEEKWNKLSDEEQKLYFGYYMTAILEEDPSVFNDGKEGFCNNPGLLHVPMGDSPSHKAVAERLMMGVKSAFFAVKNPKGGFAAPNIYKKGQPLNLEVANRILNFLFVGYKQHGFAIPYSHHLEEARVVSRAVCGGFSLPDTLPYKDSAIIELPSGEQKQVTTYSLLMTIGGATQTHEVFPDKVAVPNPTTGETKTIYFARATRVDGTKQPV